MASLSSGINLDVPRAPQWAGDPVTFGQAVDAWQAELHQRCEDPEWVRRYCEAAGIALPAKVKLWPHPERGDTAHWDRWWRNYNRAFAEAGASTDGIDDPPTTHHLSRKGRRLRWQKRVARVVRREIAAAIPSIVAAVAEVLRGR